MKPMLYLIISLLFSCGSPISKEQETSISFTSNKTIDELSKVDKIKTATPNRPIKQLLDSLKVDASNIYIHIDKSEYTLKLKSKSTVIKTYPVVLGGNPIDDKRMEGDQCTPEGTFYIISQYPHSSWTKFIWFDYPNEESYRKFKAAKKNGEIPQNARIGGEIGIHGVPEGSDYLVDEGYNWTLGCISLKTAHINEVYSTIPPKAKIVIER